MSLQVIYATRLHMQRDQLSFISAAMSSLSWWTALLLKLWAKINPPYVLSKKKKCKTCACHHSFCGCLQWARHGHHPAFHIFSYHSPAFNFFLPPLSGSSQGRWEFDTGDPFTNEHGALSMPGSLTRSESLHQSTVKTKFLWLKFIPLEIESYVDRIYGNIYSFHSRETFNKGYSRIQVTWKRRENIQS